MLQAFWAKLFDIFLYAFYSTFTKRRYSYLRFLPPVPAAARPTLEGKIGKVRKDGEQHLILFVRTSGSKKHLEWAPP